jgi:hypothetical protein
MQSTKQKNKMNDNAPPSTTTTTSTAKVKTKKTRHVRKPYAKRACINCKATRSKCDDSRPCQRCIQQGLEAECIDAERKKPVRQSSRRKKTQRTEPPVITPTISSYYLPFNPTATLTGAPIIQTQPIIEVLPPSPPVVSPIITTFNEENTSTSALSVPYSSFPFPLIPQQQQQAPPNVIPLSFYPYPQQPIPLPYTVPMADFNNDDDEDGMMLEEQVVPNNAFERIDQTNSNNITDISSPFDLSSPLHLFSENSNDQQVNVPSTPQFDLFDTQGGSSSTETLISDPVVATNSTETTLDDVDINDENIINIITKDASALASGFDRTYTDGDYLGSLMDLFNKETRGSQQQQQQQHNDILSYLKDNTQSSNSETTQVLSRHNNDKQGNGSNSRHQTTSGLNANQLQALLRAMIQMQQSQNQEIRKLKDTVKDLKEEIRQLQADKQ